jgi:hypothetical protein
MFDYDNVRIYAESRQREMLREAEVLRLLGKQRISRDGAFARLVTRAGDLLINVGVKLKAAYPAQPERSSTIQTFMQPASESQTE